jgi:hypothetical protein
MLLGYSFGIVVVAGFFWGCAGADRGNEGAAEAVKIAAVLLAVVASFGLFFALLLAVIGGAIDGSGDFWSEGRAWQFFVAILGWAAVLAMAAWALRGRYREAAGLAIVAACVFALWGLMIYGAWSGRGPLSASASPAPSSADAALGPTFSSSATHSMWGVWGNMSTGRTRRSL